MLNTIRDAIKRQKAYMEAADIILEDAGQNLDDAIVLGQTAPLGEDGSEPETAGIEDMDAGLEDGDAGEEPKDDGGDDDDVKVPEADISEEPIEDAPTEPETIKDDDIADQPIDDPTPPEGGDGSGGEEPMPLPGDDLPEPVGKQTGEPAQDDNIVDVNVDLQSNTIRDVLPVPPAGAGEAIDGDEMQSHVDPGFGGETPAPAPEDTLPDSTPPAAEEPDDGIGNEPIDGGEGETPAPSGDGDDIADQPIDGPDGSDDTTPSPEDTLKEAASQFNQVMNMVHQGAANGTTPTYEQAKAQFDKLYEAIASAGAPNPTALLRSELDSAQRTKKQLEEMAKKAPKAAAKYQPLIDAQEKRIKDLKDQISTASKAFTEAITLAGDTSAPAEEPLTAEGAAGAAPDAGGAPAEDPLVAAGAAADAATGGEEATPDAAPAAEGEGENEVTAAVRDKVSEIDNPAPGSGDKEELLQKLSNITKNLEDAKKAVLNTIQ